MTDLTLNVPDIHCDHCKHSIESAVRSLAGVEKVEVHIDERTVDVTFDDPADQHAISNAIEDVGYVVA